MEKVVGMRKTNLPLPQLMGGGVLFRYGGGQMCL